MRGKTGDSRCRIPFNPRRLNVEEKGSCTMTSADTVKVVLFSGVPRQHQHLDW